MDLHTPVQTAHGEASLEEVLKYYNKAKQYEINKSEWLKTEAGKQYNRQKAKEYYERNKDKVLEKRAKKYEAEKDVLLNRAKQYYSLHSEELIEKNRQRRLQSKKLKGEEA